MSRLFALAWLSGAGCGGPAKPAPAPQGAPVAEAAAPASPAGQPTDWAARYEELRAGFDRDSEHFGGPAGSPEFAELSAELRTMGEAAPEIHLKANAALLLGALHQIRGHHAEAAAAFTRAEALVPDDAGPAMALAVVLAAQGSFAEAAAAQARAAALDPDNLENYLTLGELWTRAGEPKKAEAAYAAYETRRKGLIDGLTLGHDGVYRLSVEGRVACAEALASSTDVGTANALIYALATDPDGRVRGAVARTMGILGLTAFTKPLQTALTREQNEGARTQIAWALGEIERAPVELSPVPPPVPTPPPRP